MDERRIKFIIDKQGNITVETLDGFSGTSCVEKMKHIQVLLGGEQMESGKTGAYYDPDYENPVSINMN